MTVLATADFLRREHAPSLAFSRYLIARKLWYTRRLVLSTETCASPWLKREQLVFTAANYTGQIFIIENSWRKDVILFDFL